MGLTTCIDPFEPLLDNTKNFVVIRGRVTDYPGDSQVTLFETALLLGNYVSQPVSGAEVLIKDEDGEIFPLEESDEENGTYFSPASYKGTVGRTYQLQVTFPDGRVYYSSQETIHPGVTIDSLSTQFDQEYGFSQKRKEFIPAHRIAANWRDPADQNNFYQWGYDLFKFTIVCKSCFGGIYRGEPDCMSIASIPVSNRFDYYCNEACWTIQTVNNIHSFSDEFVNGKGIKNFEIANITFESRQSILVKVKQYSISSEQHRFNQVLSEQALGGGGLNASLPGFVSGNLYNPNNPEEKVIGFFSASAVSVKSIYINRTSTPGDPLGEGLLIQPEPPGPDKIIPQAPCKESRFRTAIKPEGWP